MTNRFRWLSAVPGENFGPRRGSAVAVSEGARRRRLALVAEIDREGRAAVRERYGWEDGQIALYLSGAREVPAWWRWRPSGRVDWRRVDLGARPDSEIADELGVSVAAVFQMRRKMGIPRHYPEPTGALGVNVGVDWDEQPLGDEPDGEIARRLGVTSRSVRRARERRGIAPAVKPTEALAVDWTSLPLGLESDASIARSIGCDPSTVRKHRRRLGIPSARASRSSTPTT